MHRPAPRRHGPARWTLAALALLSACAGHHDATPTVGAATHRSSAIAVSPDGREVWVANRDHGSVTRIDAATNLASPPVVIGGEPSHVALAPDGSVVVLDRAAGTLVVLRDGDRADLALGGGVPAGMALDPAGHSAYVSLAASGEVVRVDLTGLRVAERADVGPAPGAVAVMADPDAAGGVVVVVAHERSRPRAAGGPDRNDGMEAWLTLLDGSLAYRGELVIDPYEAFGFANVVGAIDARAGRIVAPHALNAPEGPAAFNRLVSAAVSGWAAGAESGAAATPVPDVRLHLNDPTFSTPVNAPAAVALTPDGWVAYVVLAGSDQLMGIALGGDAPRLLGFWPTGANPVGVALSGDGTRAFVANRLSRDVSVIDLRDPRNRTGGVRVVVAPETWDEATWLGARLFHHAADPRMSTLGWIACASCHPDGGSDGTTWRTPEGPRQTRPLWRLDLTGPPFHASATRDELQDFHHEIEVLMRGVGMLDGRAHALLGEPNAGRSQALDALARFVERGFPTPAAAPGRAAAERGRAVFERSGCQACHGGPGWTRNALPGPPGEAAPVGAIEVTAALVDVGTFKPEQGGLGANGFKVPTLLGLHAGSRYLHDGSAPDLAAVLAEPRHAGTLSSADRDDLVAFLRSIDGDTPPFE